MGTDIRVGTASWTDPGFVKDWYPRGLPASARLRWYAGHFNYVEVNSTFYAIPTARTVDRWVQETPDDFLFDLKLPKVFSRHRMQVKFLPADLRAKVPNERGYVVLTPASEERIAERFLREVRPLIDGKKLGVLLLQLSPAFSPRDHALGELDLIRRALAPHQLAIELRNRHWVLGEQRAATLDFFASRRLSLVMVDAPNSEHFTVMPGLDAVTDRRLAYFRLHGRNAAGYIKGRSVSERFDYDYPVDELEEIAGRIREMAPKVDAVHVAANNNHSNYAPRTAQWIAEAVGAGPKIPVRQAELF